MLSRIALLERQFFRQGRRAPSQEPAPWLFYGLMQPFAPNSAIWYTFGPSCGPDWPRRSSVMSAEDRFNKSGQRQQGSKEPRRSDPSKRRPWHPPVFSTLEVAATEQVQPDNGGGGGSHCWN